MMIVGYFVIGLLMAIIIYLDSKKFRKQVEDGDVEQVFKIQDIKTWLILILLIGVFALPTYAIKTRGRGGKGFLYAIILLAIYIGMFTVILIVAPHFQKSDNPFVWIPNS